MRIVLPFASAARTRQRRRRANALGAVGLAVALSLFITPLASLADTSASASDSDYRLSSLRVFNRVVLLVKEQYVEPSRIKPRAMLIAALEAVEKRIPEVMVDAADDERSLTVTVGEAQRRYVLDDIASLWELSFKLRDVFRFLETRISPEVDRREVEYAAVNGMLSKLDPHSVLLEPKSSEEMKLSTKGEFGGLGIVISIRDGWLTVISPIDGTPADRAGIRAQDRITKIGEESTINMGLDEAVERLRGEPGTDVTIWITRKGMEEPKKFTITRAQIKVDSVTHELLADGIGYVKVKAFQGRTAEDVAAAVRDMRAANKGQLAGIILDLRNNPGGLLDQSVEVSNLFLEDGVIVVTQEGGVRGERKEIRAIPRPDKIAAPLVVLVNGGSASASEIVSGAIKNRGRGLIVGDQTFGKGSVQQLYDFPDSSSLKLTIGQYLTPGDESIQSVGITPDVLIRPVLADSADEVNLFPDDLAREEDLAAHLDDARTKSRKPEVELAYLTETLDESELQRRETSSEFHSDFEIDFARRVLKTAPRDATTRASLLVAARSAVDAVRAEEDTKIFAALKKFNVDWSEGAGGGKLEVTLVSAKPVDAGQTLELTVQAKNVGDKPLFRVRGNTESTLGYYADREFLYGALAPGEAREWTSKIKIPKDLITRRDIVRVNVSDDSEKATAKIDIPVEVSGQPRPGFSYALFIDDSRDGNGDGLLQVGEDVELVVSVKNAGKGSAERPMALLKHLGGPEVFIDKGRQQLDELKSGASAVARFSFKVREARDTVSFRLQVFDSVMGDYLVEKLTFPIRESAPKAKKRNQTVQVSRAGVPVYAAADGQADVIARAEVGSKLDAVAEVGGFVRVKIGKDLYGYVAEAEVGPTKGRPVVDAHGEPKGLSPVYGRDPPEIKVGLATAPTPVVKDRAVKIPIKVVDDGAVNDVYVFVGDEKVFYKKLGTEGPTDVGLEASVPLEPGVNLITVIAREDEEFAQREVFTVYCEAGDPFAKRKLIERH